MSFLSKVELKTQLRNLGIRVEGNYVVKSDVEKVLSARKIKRQTPMTANSLSNELTGICATLHEMKSDFKKFGFTRFTNLDAAITSLNDFCDEFDESLKIEKE